MLIANNNGVVYFDDVSFRNTMETQSEDLFILMVMIIYLLVLQEILIFFTMVLLIGLQNSG